MNSLARIKEAALCIPLPSGRWLRSILHASSVTIQISSMQRCAASMRMNLFS